MGIPDEFHRLLQRTKKLREGTVLGAQIAGGRVEVEVRIAPSGKEIWAEMTHGLGGSRGGTVRVPTPGESVLVGMIDGDPTQGFVLGGLSDASTPIPSDISQGRTYYVAPDGEGIEIRAGADGSTRVEVEPNGVVKVSAKRVELAGSAGKLARADKIKQLLEEWALTFNNHTHPYADGVTGSTTTPQEAEEVDSGSVFSD